MGMEDYAYRYPGIRNLTAEHNLYNADTYALFASAVDLNCPSGAAWWDFGGRQSS